MFDIYYTAIILVLTTLALVFNLYKPGYILSAALLFLYIGGIVTLDDVLSGFSNQGMLTIAVLYIIAATLQASRGFQYVTGRILGNGRKKGLYFRLMFPVTLLSAFLNNTPVVAALIPVLRRWSQKYNFPASRLMIPLSYAAIVGGMCTLIGTSTNLIVHGLLLEKGFQGFGFFEIGIVGVPVALVVILYFGLVGHRLLPLRKDAFSQIQETTREFVVEVKIGQEYPNLGRSIAQANLRHLRGLFLFQIIRSEQVISPVAPHEEIQVNDRLFFTGMPETIYDLVKTPGFHVVKDHVFDLRNIDSDKQKTYEAVISNTSPLVGETVRDSGFRTKYNAVILAIHRNGLRIEQKVGDIEFQPNDTLFILAGRDFERKWYHSSDFSLVSKSVEEYSKPRLKGNLAFILVALMVLAVATGLIRSMLVAAAITAGIMILTRIISYHDARNAIDLHVLLVIVAALGIGRGIANSGIADMVAGAFMNRLAGYGVLAIIVGLYFITSFYTEIITNNAAAAMMFPVVFALALKTDIPLQPLMITMAIATSSSFATPIGYQTNMMVYSPGGYRFADYLKAGLIINILVGIVTTLVVYWWYF